MSENNVNNEKPPVKSSDLLCCPFCGCAMQLTVVGRDWYRIKPVVWHDDECPLDGKAFDYSQSEPASGAISMWNMRTK